MTFKQAKKELDKYVLDLKESLKLYKKVFIEEVVHYCTLLKAIFYLFSPTHASLLDSFGLSTLQYPAIQRTSAQEQFEEKIKHIDKKQLISKKGLVESRCCSSTIIYVSALGVSNKEKINYLC